MAWSALARITLVEHINWMRNAGSVLKTKVLVKQQCKIFFSRNSCYLDISLTIPYNNNNMLYGCATLFLSLCQQQLMCPRMYSLKLIKNITSTSLAQLTDYDWLALLLIEHQILLGPRFTTVVCERRYTVARRDCEALPGRISHSATYWMSCWHDTVPPRHWLGRVTWHSLLCALSFTDGRTVQFWLDDMRSTIAQLNSKIIEDKPTPVVGCTSAAAKFT